MSDLLSTLLPAAVPQFPSTAPARLCRWIFRRCGWRVVGEFPDLAKLVLIAAPHSSNWDAVWGILAKVALRLDLHFIGKREAFFWPLGVLLRGVGGIPIDRHRKHDVVAQMSAEFAQRERFWFGVAPEGTRKQVTKWRSGFWHIARAARVPILPCYFSYPDKTIGVLPLFVPSDDLDADMRRLRAIYAPYQGKNRGTA
ncbi:MAG: lysophospholipid acyltransferase family protein [Rudaea sp.]